MHGNEQEFLASVSPGLGLYYLVLAVTNGVAALYLWISLGKNRNALVWLIVGMFFTLLSAISYGGAAPAMPDAVKRFIDANTGPVIYSAGTLALLLVVFLARRFFAQPVVAWSGLNAVLLLMGLSMTDPDFMAIVGKPDNVPIVAMLYLVGFFTWLAMNRAVRNDERALQGLPPLEAEDNEKVLVWPDLVYTEMICMIGLTALLLVWSIVLKAPLEEPASSVKTPNPSKAPWYFLGLQEMLVYYDPWWAGVVLPSLVIFGLMAIPYMDFNKQGNGYYTIAERSYSYLVFQFGFLVLWITLIVLGTFLRGPNWNFFGPFEYWDPHKVLALNNIDLSEYFWVLFLGKSLPEAPPDSGALVQLGYILQREWLGIVLVLGYIVLLPPILAATVFKGFFVKMGFLRYMLMVNLLLLMLTLPLKMLGRWIWDLKYIISIPEYFLNF